MQIVSPFSVSFVLLIVFYVPKISVVSPEIPPEFVGCVTRAPSQYPKRRLFVRSRKVSKPRDWYFKLSYRFEIWQAHRQHCCRSACQISERSDNSKYKSRGFETLRDLTEIRLFGYWDGAQNPTVVKYSIGHSCNPVCACNVNPIEPKVGYSLCYRAQTKSAYCQI